MNAISILGIMMKLTILASFIEVFTAPFTQTLVALMLSTFVTMLLEHNRRPKLSLAIKKTELKKTIHATKPAQFWSVGLSLLNKAPSRWTAWFTTREAALRAQATIKFYNSDGVILIFTMQGRWTSSPQPPELLDLRTNQLSPFTRENLRFLEIYPGKEEGIDVAVRFVGEEICYGFSTDSYCQDLWHNPNSKLEKGQYIVEVTVQHSGGKPLSKRFRLRNDGLEKDFTLEER
jgi:hypothetical protein